MKELILDVALMLESNQGLRDIYNYYQTKNRLSSLDYLLALVQVAKETGLLLILCIRGYSQ
jgi:hypothetical protein